jgi:hypothetical protein
MKILPLYTNINGTDYWIGFSIGGADVTGDGVIDVSDDTLSSIQYYDSNGNPQWILNSDGTTTQQTIAPTQDQIEIASLSTNQQSVSDLIPQILDCLVNGNAITQDLIDSWNGSRQSIATATTAMKAMKTGSAKV